MRLTFRLARRPRSWRAASGLVLVGLSVCLTAGCSDEPPDDLGPMALPVADPQEPSTLERYEIGELSFGDPGELDGFEPVTDTDTYELEPHEETAEPVATPDEVIPKTPEVSLEDDREVLSQVWPVDEAPTSEELPDDRDGKRRNEIGELITIDDVASVACGNVEIALNELDAGDAAAAAAHLSRAAELAEESTTIGMEAWVSPLGSQAEAAKTGAAGSNPQLLIAFLKACSDGGYEL